LYHTTTLIYLATNNLVEEEEKDEKHWNCRLRHTSEQTRSTRASLATTVPPEVLRETGEVIFPSLFLLPFGAHPGPAYPTSPQPGYCYLTRELMHLSDSDNAFKAGVSSLWAGAVVQFGLRSRSRVPSERAGDRGFKMNMDLHEGPARPTIKRS